MLKAITEKTKRFFMTLSLAGLIFGFLAFYVTLMPMLLPRVWLVQAVCCGVAAAIGYAFGKLLSKGVDAFCYVCGKEAFRLPSAYRKFVMAFGVALLFGVTTYHHQVMEKTRLLMDMPSESVLKTVAGVIIGLFLWLFLVVVCRFLVLLTESLVNLLVPNMHISVRAVGWVVSSVVVLSVVFGVTRYTLWQPALQKISQAALKLDQTDPKALIAPVVTYRSGSEGAAQPWASLGHYGQRFASLGLSASEITALTGRSAKEPIRVFAGLDNEEPDAATFSKVVEIAMSELDRTDAWSRRYLVLHGATGRGWVEEYSSLAVEYLTDGDVASVAVQYSYLPSQVSYLMDSEASSYANQQLYDAIKKKLASLPKENRPKLYLAGESLGAYATQSNFSNMTDLIQGIDGAVWVGTPRLSSLWQNLVASRMAGTSEGLPIIESGRHVRFMDYPETLGEAHPNAVLYGEWAYPRVVFVQYASDPIVWWSPRMIYARPDWMREPAGRDVARVPTWLPVLSFWELSLDMPASSDTPAGHGHIYRYDTIGAWQAVLGHKPNAEQADEIARAIDERIEAFLPERVD
ncbi:MAG: alpha/beta-hydrolase family protein [Moraxella sp.]|nr:alpha/beta-hydrolase family protein [Moraxella sp.]